MEAEKNISLILSVVVGFAAVILAHECMHSQLFFNIISCAHTFSVPHCASSSSFQQKWKLLLQMLIIPIYKDWSKEAGTSSNKHMVLQECVFSEVLIVRLQ